MPRIARVVVPDYPHHITQRGVRSMKVFEFEHNYRYYLKLLKKNSDRFGLEIIAYCLMPNHTHIVAIPKSVTSIAKAIGETHRKYTVSFNRRKKTTGYLFQGRFFSCPMDFNHLLAAVAYIECNPVDAGMVQKPWNYPWSSCAFHIGQKKEDPLVKRSPLFEDVKDWKDFLSSKVVKPKELIKNTHTGRPIGDGHFIKKIENMTGRNLRPKKRGRRQKMTITSISRASP